MATDKTFSETQSQKLWDKTKEAPFVPIGLLGTLGMIIYGITQYKNRKGMSTSVYLMEYRVKAQGVIVGAITLGVGYSLLRDHVFNKKAKAEGKK